MDANLVEKLKIACNAFYMNIGESDMSDIEFDALRTQFEKETGESVKNLVDWDSEVSMMNEPMQALNKIIAGDNDLNKSLLDFIGRLSNNTCFVCNYKYDGSSIKAYYNKGKLQMILGTPDVAYGFVRTKAFWNLFPQEVPEHIKSIQGEVLVDASVYGQLARNKANGLTNSKWKDQEVADEAFIRVYKIEYVDCDWSLKRQMSDLANLPTIKSNRIRPRLIEGEVKVAEGIDEVFKAAQHVRKCPNEPIVYTDSVALQVDGVVIYTDQFNQLEDMETGGVMFRPIIQGIKFYYTESQVTTVNNVQWNRKPNGSFVPVLNIDTITLNEKYINNVASGGVPNMIAQKIGRGAKVRVILANMTIPKIVEVLEESEDYQWPKCECGYQLSDEDIYGATLKCQEYDKPCDYKVERLRREIILDCHEDIQENAKNNVYFRDYFIEWFDWFFDRLQIDRFSSNSRWKSGLTEEDIKVLKLNWSRAIENDDIDALRQLFKDSFNYSDLNWCNFDINLRSWLFVLHQVSVDWFNIDANYAKEYFPDAF